MGTQFQESVWNALRLIPEGKVTTYGAIATYLKTGAIRAVGSAVGKNPNAPQIPCHRVVRKDGTIGQYSGGEGTPTKIKLLAAEGISVKKGKIIDFENILWTF